MSLTLRRYTIAALLISGAVLYSSWVLAFFLNSGEGPFEGFASQLAATDQRYGILYRSGDLLTGIVLTVAAVLGLTITPRRFPHHGRLARAGCLRGGHDRRFPSAAAVFHGGLRGDAGSAHPPVARRHEHGVGDGRRGLGGRVHHRDLRLPCAAGDVVVRLAVVVLFLVGTLWMLVGVDDPSGSHSCWASRSASNCCR